MANNYIQLGDEVLIDLRHDTVAPEVVLPEVTFHGADGRVYQGALATATQAKNGLMSKEDKYKLDNISNYILQSDTMAHWQASRYVPRLNEIIIYSDYGTDSGKRPVPMIKIGNGYTGVNDLPFMDADILRQFGDLSTQIFDELEDLSEDINNIQGEILGGTHYLGETTTALSDGATDTSVVIGETSVNVTSGDIVIYGKKEYIFSDTDNKWHEFGIDAPIATTDVAGVIKSGGDISVDENGNVSLVGLNGKEIASIEDIPTKLSDLESDDDNLLVTKAEKEEWSSKSSFSGSYEDLTDKPVIDSKVQQSSTNAVENKAIYSALQSKQNTIDDLEAIRQGAALGSSALQSFTETDPIYSADKPNIALKSEIPTRISDLENDNSYIDKTVSDLVNYYQKSETYTQAEVNQLVTEIPKFSIQVVSTLPSSEISNTTIYLLKSGEETENLYTEYIYVDSQWEKLGTQKVDLTGYALKTDIPTKVSELTNDEGYLTEHQDLSEYAKNEDVPTALSQLADDSNHRLVTDAEKQVWANKSSFSGDYNDLTNKPTIPTNVSAFNNDVGYLTEHQDISGKQDKLSDAQLANLNADHSKYLTEHQSLADYAKTEQLPTKVSDLTNDVGYITEDKNTTYTFQTTETGFIVTPSDGEPQTLDVGSNIDIDTELDEESENPVQNKAVATAIGTKADKTELPTKTSDLVNDSSFVPVISITKHDYERLTEAELTSNILYWVVDEDAEDGYEDGNEEAY